MSKISNENYLLIQGWMVNELKLKGNELLVYAIIYGFSQAENQHFKGSLQYLADWTNSSKQGIQKNIKSLLDKGFIFKKEKYINGVKFVEYYTTKFNEGIQQSCTNNINNNTNLYINNINNSELEKALSNFEEMRKKIKKPLTDNAKELLLKKLDKIANTEEEKIEILNQSILNCWQGVFPLKAETKHVENSSSFNITKFDV